jgi:hypothetical protein
MRLIDFQYQEERNFRTLSPSFYGHSTLVVKLEAMGLKGFEGSRQDASNLDAGLLFANAASIKMGRHPNRGMKCPTFCHSPQEPV